MGPRHLIMIAMGGVIGSFLSSGYTIQQAGPLGAVLAYLVGAGGRPLLRHPVRRALLPLLPPSSRDDDERWQAGWVSAVTVVSAPLPHLAHLLRKVADEGDEVWDELA